MKTTIFAACALVVALLPVQASAQEWFTKTEEDVFSGKSTAVMISVSPRSDSVYMACDAERAVRLSYIFKYDDEIDTNLRGVVVIKADTGETMRFDATAYKHNDEYSGFTADLSGDDASRVLKAIAGAKRKILTGLAVDAINFKASLEIAASGSSRAATQFMKACEIS